MVKLKIKATDSFFAGETWVCNGHWLLPRAVVQVSGELGGLLRSGLPIHRDQNGKITTGEEAKLLLPAFDQVLPEGWQTRKNPYTLSRIDLRCPEARNGHHKVLSALTRDDESEGDRIVWVSSEYADAFAEWEFHPYAGKDNGKRSIVLVMGEFRGILMPASAKGTLERVERFCSMVMVDVKEAKEAKEATEG